MMMSFNERTNLAGGEHAIEFQRGRPNRVALCLYDCERYEIGIQYKGLLHYQTSAMRFECGITHVTYHRAYQYEVQ